jgi:hypothetical protein
MGEALHKEKGHCFGSRVMGPLHAAARFCPVSMWRGVAQAAGRGVLA